MYDDHYGLSGRPFLLTPDPRFWFDTATHKKAMAYLGYGLSQGEGFIVITGDIGAGKTTLVGHLMATLDHERLNIVRLVSTQSDPEDLLRTVAAGMAIEGAGLAKSQLLAGIERQLHAFARAGKRTLLIVDEAQALPTASLEELRMLSNFQAGGYSLLQIFLLGQPEFRDRLADPRLEQLRQRVIAMHHLGPMEPGEIEAYLAHRLSVVGWTGRPDFTPEAVAAMHQWSGGIPRRINQLASRILLHGAIEEIDSFSGAQVAHVIADLDGDMAGTAASAAPVASQSPTPAPVAAPTAHEPRPILPEIEVPAAPTPPILLHEPVADLLQSAPKAQLEPEPEPEPQPQPVAHLAPPIDLALARRLAELETRMEDQDDALRRVLTLLVDWVEVGGNRPDFSTIRDGVGRG